MVRRATALMPRGALVVMTSAPFFEFNTLWVLSEARRAGDAWEIATWSGSYISSGVAVIPYESALVAISFGLGQDDWVDLCAFGRYERNIQTLMDPRTNRGAQHR